MSIYGSFCCMDGDYDLPAPIIYSGSHVMPTADSERGGSLDLGLIAGYVTHNGLDRVGNPDPSGDEGVWPYLRVSVSPVQPPAEQRRLNRKLWLWGRVIRTVMQLRKLGLDVRLPHWQWPAHTVVLDRDQAVELREALSTWLFRCDDPDRWLADQNRTPRHKARGVSGA